jgi:hypothetical protein
MTTGSAAVVVGGDHEAHGGHHPDRQQRFVPGLVGGGEVFVRGVPEDGDGDDHAPGLAGELEQQQGHGREGHAHADRHAKVAVRSDPTWSPSAGTAARRGGDTAALGAVATAHLVAVGLVAVGIVVRLVVRGVVLVGVRLVGVGVLVRRLLAGIGEHRPARGRLDILLVRHRRALARVGRLGLARLLPVVSGHRRPLPGRFDRWGRGGTPRRRTARPGR